ncbi:hypothetical protein BD626DRAFT_575701 [Schizophyllum amplum]|uniref:UBC core domain-containing protein n=1 Tax=Schizophyllum amplum TaxID=97359 RepID=A0A550BV95_9AGAR|nr:hypothetical protein BD626DRAFT_575701 [Auriculariopsis ampla]
MKKDPPSLVWAAPDERNIPTWIRNFITKGGPPDWPFAGGEFHGQLLYPPKSPVRPPGIKMLTPSRRLYPGQEDLLFHVRLLSWKLADGQA